MPKPKVTPSATMTVNEAAALLGMDVRTVHRQVQSGKLPGFKAFDGLRAPYVLDRESIERIAADRTEAAS